MTNDLQDPLRDQPARRARGLIAALVLLAFAALIFSAGRYLYAFGQNTAARLAGFDPSASETPSPTITSTATITHTFTPSPTNTSFFPPTATPTPTPNTWTSCPGIVVTVNDTSAGDIVHVVRCSDGLEYDIGPLTKGVYAVSPDDRYFVYASLNGIVYAARIGDATLAVIRKTRREFYTFGQDMDPIYRLSFTGESPYVLEVYEARFGQNLPIRMPGWLAEE